MSLEVTGRHLLPQRVIKVPVKLRSNRPGSVGRVCIRSRMLLGLPVDMPEKLSTYRAMRDPKKTPEPMGKGAPAAKRRSKKLTFVIQEHHARALHWDFRLEREGVLVSWALPKGLPESPKTNHLAVHTEDHPLEYGKFAGNIPKGEYGGGNVTIWDHGTYELEKWSDREVMVVLHGERSEGRYVLFATGGKNWMIHRMDPPREGFEQMPSRVRPMLALAGTLPKDDKGWAYEFKWDGVRAILYIDGGRVRAMSRNDKDLTAGFPELRQIGEFMGSRSCILDGEIVAFDDDGRPSFGRLQQRLNLGSASLVTKRAREVPVSFLAFDIVYLEGKSLLSESYDKRREVLEALDLKGDTFATSPSISDANGEEILDVAKERGLEGVVVKRRTSKYVQGQRNGDWVKVKYFKTQEVVIGGWTAGKGEREGSLGALLVGIPDEGGLLYSGKVGTGFTQASRRELLNLLEALSRKTSPFSKALSPAETALAHFVKPKIVGEVRYGEWTSDGHLRHPSWRGLRPDKNPEDVVTED
jgi:bifunctional non-homologous end joining protein LigD